MKHHDESECSPRSSSVILLAVPESRKAHLRRLDYKTGARIDTLQWRPHVRNNFNLRLTSHENSVKLLSKLVYRTRSGDCNLLR